MKKKLLVLSICALAGVMFSAPQLALAVDIQVSSYGNLTAAQKAVVDAKIALWEGRLPHQNPEHVVTLTFDNADLGARKTVPGPGVEFVLAGPGGIRGTEGATLAQATDFTEDANGRPTGATITINNNAAITWHTGLNPPVPAGQSDLWSVINHELMHALGFTVANSRFRRNVTTDAPGGVTDPRKYNRCGLPTATLVPEQNGAGESQGTHTDPTAHPGDLMNPNIPSGQRREPSQLDIDILLDDVWSYPVIQGRLSNFDVWNRCGFVANDFEVRLGGILDSSVENVYDGVFNPFTPPNGTVTQDGTTAVIKWGPPEDEGQVNPGDKAHFGFTIKGDITPTSVTLTWTQNNVPVCTIPVNKQLWKTLSGGNGRAADGIQSTIVNSSGVPLWIQRRVNTSTTPVVLDDLLVGSPLDIDASEIDSSPVRLLPGECALYDFSLSPEMWGVVMIYDSWSDAGGSPGELLGTFLTAAQAPPSGVPAVSEWGLVGLTLLVLSAGTVVLGRRRRLRAA